MPQAKTHLAIIIPVYNEGKVIKQVIESLPKKIEGINKISILAINDGSTDNSELEIKNTRAMCFNLPINLGPGSATLTGLKLAKDLSVTAAVTFDGDGQHSPSDIAKLIKPIIDQKADLVIGSRMLNHKGMPIIKKIGNFGLNFITYALSRKWTSDSQSGFKAFSQKALNTIELNTIGYEFCSEIIMEASKNKLKIKEVPIKVIYSRYSKKKGQSILNGINIVAKLLFRKITG